MIRQMLKNDEKEIKRVEEIWLNESIRVHNFISENFWRGDGLSNFRKTTRDADGYVYEEDDIIKGFITMENRGTMENSYIYIFELFVDQHYRNEGKGTKLLDLAKHSSRSLYLHVYVRNFKAINWYFGRGFVIAHTHEPEPQNPKQLKYKMVWPKPLAPKDC